MSPRSLILAAAMTVGVSGHGLAQPAPQRVAVTRIEVNSPPGATDLFPTVFRARVAEKLAKCAAGTYPTTLKVTVTKYRRADPALKDLVAPMSLLQGTAELIDPATGAVLTTHQLKRASGGGGDLNYTFATLADVEAQMASDFGDEICKRMFTRG